MFDLIVSLFWFLLIFGGAIYLAYQRIDLTTSTIATGVVVAAYTVYTIAGNGWWLWMLMLWAALGVMIVPNLTEVRREKITKPLLAVYRTMLPSMSDTEREALEAGSVWWDGELFSGMPDWDRLMSFPAPSLTEEEQAFLDGPCEELCRMLDDWEICHERADLPPQVWDFIIKHRFFAMIIPKKYGGPGGRQRDPLLRTDLAGSRFGRGIADRQRRRLQGHVERQDHYGHQAQLEQALHHAGSGGDGPRPGLQAV